MHGGVPVRRIKKKIQHLQAKSLSTIDRTGPDGLQKRVFYFNLFVKYNVVLVRGIFQYNICMLNTLKIHQSSTLLNIIMKPDSQIVKNFIMINPVINLVVGH